jgi:voltage-gated potassium channel
MNKFRSRLHEIVYETDTPAGRAFDLVLIWAIILSVLTVILDSVSSLHDQYGQLFLIIEWIFTIMFSMEYILRIYCIQKPWKYVFSYFGIIDLMSFVPTYLSIIIPGLQTLIVVRILRLLRLFRILKMARYVAEASTLLLALKASKQKIIVFLSSVITIVLISGSLMYIVEGPASGFDSVPRGMYWAIVTLTTVGFGDIVPVTVFGQFLASVIMILGYGIIAVPTGIVSVELAKISNISNQACPSCGREGHEHDATHCKFCGTKL